jgi:hypothetical protein
MAAFVVTGGRRGKVVFWGIVCRIFKLTGKKLKKKARGSDAGPGAEEEREGGSPLP